MECSQCKVEKPESEFYLKKAGDPLAGRRARCKVCARPANTPTLRAQKAKWQREWRQANPERNWARYLRAYGTTPEWYEAKLAEQGGLCAICRRLDGTGDRLAVDHDHGCCPSLPLCGGCNRGLLCRGCNVGIGNLGDDADRLRAAADYLDRR